MKELVTEAEWQRVRDWEFQISKLLDDGVPLRQAIHTALQGPTDKRLWLQTPQGDRPAQLPPMSNRELKKMQQRSSLLNVVELANGELAWPLAQANGIKEATFRHRLNMGMSPDEAATRRVAKPLTGDELEASAALILPSVADKLRSDPETPKHVLAWLESAQMSHIKAEQAKQAGNAEYAQNYQRTKLRWLARVSQWLAEG